MTTAAQQRNAGVLRRRRAVVMNADIADYSRLMADDEAATVACVREYQVLVAEGVEGEGGTLVNFVGDSFVAVVDDVRSAMRTAIRICGAVRERNRALPKTRRMWFRLGLDIGEIVVADDGRYFGEPLNVAARVQSIAEVGGINVTEAVFNALDEPALRLIGLGRRRLKNIPEMVRVYRLEGMSAADGDRDVPAPNRRTRPSVAVLPVIGADGPATRDIAGALHLELTAALSQIPGLRVIDVAVAATDVARPADLAAELGAAYCLATGLARSGERLRAYAEVADVTTFNRIWGQRWEGTTADAFALQDALTAGTMRALEVELVVGEPARIYRAALDDETRLAVYRGWYELLHNTREGWRRATELFGSIAESGSAEKVRTALLSFVLWWGAISGMSEDPQGDLDRAGAFAQRGRQLGDETGLSHTVIAALQLHGGGDLRGALAEATEALSRRPTCDVSFAVQASVQRYLGTWEAAIESSRRALDLSLMPNPWYTNVLASAYYVGERYHDAADVAEQLVGTNAETEETLLVLAAAQQALGLPRRAGATVALIQERFPALRCEDLQRRHPFRDPKILERWSRHLAAAGLP